MLRKRTISLKKALLIGAVVGVLSAGALAQQKKAEKRTKPDLTPGKSLFLQYCASCHGADAKGNGPAAIAMKVPPPDLTELTKRNEGRYPAGYVGALLKFGRNLASHGSLDMPVWGHRFKSLDPADDPTGQKHVDEVVAYIESLQAK